MDRTDRSIFRFDDFELDAHRLELRRAGRPVRADPLVLRLLTVLVRAAGNLVSSRELVSEVWDGRSVSPSVLSVAMARLRRTLGGKDNGFAFVNSVHGRGYRFVRPVIAQNEPLESMAVASDRMDAGPAFVGRERVVARMRASLAEARAGRGSICLLTGEPGIGKTSVVEVLAKDAARAGTLVTWAQCPEAIDSPPLWVFEQLLREVSDRCVDRERDRRAAGSLQRASRLIHDLVGEGGRAPSRDGAEQGGASRIHLCEAITRALSQACEQTCGLLVIDDLHRADAASLEILRYWLQTMARTRVLLLGTARMTLTTERSWRMANRHLTHILGHRNCTHIALGRLEETAVAEYVASTVKDPDPQWVRAVFAKSEGNPLFMVELTRRLCDEESLNVETLTIPRAALELVRGRVLAFDDAVQGVLSCAAVMGRTFELGILQTVLNCPAAALMASLDEAIAHEVVEPVPGSQTAFVFGHDLFRQVLYERLAPGERRRWHLRILQALQDRTVWDRPPPTVLAYHAHSALPEGDLGKTVDYCSKAAAAAARAHGYADAVGHVRRAREALDLMENASPHLRLALMLEQARFARICSLPEFEPLAREVIRLARAQNCATGAANAAVLLTAPLGFPVASDSRKAVAEAVAMLGEGEALRGALLAWLATNGPIAYDAHQSLAQIKEAILLARPDSGAAGLALIALAYCTGDPGDRQKASDAAQEAEQIGHEGARRNPFLQVLLEMHWAIAAMQRGDLASASSALEQMMASCQTLHGYWMLWHAERFRALLCAEEGRLSEGVAALRALHRRLVSESLPGAEVLCLYDQVVVLGEAATVPPSSLRKVFSHEACDPPGIWSLKVRALAGAGLHEEARAGLRTVTPERLARLPRDRDYLGTLGALTRAAIILGEREYADALDRLLRPYSELIAVHVSFACEGSVEQLRGELAQMLGQPAEALRHFEAAIARSESAGLRGCAARARLAMASWRSSHRANGLRRGLA